MTSSLVGSEMCIRDSSWCTHSWRLPSACFQGVSLPPYGVVALRTALAAVSYTHLTLPTICSV
eukprot:3113937-Prorocentrum_lima.AAC.1